MTEDTTRPQPRWLRTAARILLVPYLIVLLLITWLPGDDAETVTGVVATLASWFETFGVPFAVGYPALEFFANIALFMPFGVLVAVGWPMTPLWSIVAAALATSCMIEAVQLALPSRFPTVSDVLANASGGLVGCLIARYLGIPWSHARAIFGSSPRRIEPQGVEGTP